MISLLCPTRGRIPNVVRLIDSVLETTSVPDNIEFVFRVDEDDTLTDVLQHTLAKKSVASDVVWGKRGALSDMWNDCWRAASGPIFMLCADDLVFQTPYWDVTVQLMFEEFPDRIVHVFGNDLVVKPPDKYGTHGFLHAAWCNAVGHFVPPGFPCDFVDSWLNTVAGHIGRNRYVPIITEHVHPSVGKAAADETFLYRRRQFEHANKLYAISGDAINRDISILKSVIGGNND